MGPQPRRLRLEHRAAAHQLKCFNIKSLKFIVRRNGSERYTLCISIELQYVRGFFCNVEMNGKFA
jgi:hypothetical protein